MPDRTDRGDPPTLDRRRLGEIVARELSIDKGDARQLNEHILRAIGGALESGEEVMISRFGKFKLIDKAERPARNPNTGEEVTLPPRRVVSFLACLALRRRVNEA